jgi:ankyrin repeat protein
VALCWWQRAGGSACASTSLPSGSPSSARARVARTPLALPEMHAKERRAEPTVCLELIWSLCENLVDAHQEKRSPLHIAIITGHNSITKVLVEAKADVNLPCGSSSTYVKQHHSKAEQHTPLTLALARAQESLGLKWKEAKKPSAGTEIKNEVLVAALQNQVEFKKEEWEKIRVANLSNFSYIKAGDRYFKPAEDEAAAVLYNNGARGALLYAVKKGLDELVTKLISHGHDLNEHDEVVMSVFLSSFVFRECCCACYAAWPHSLLMHQRIELIHRCADASSGSSFVRRLIEESQRFPRQRASKIFARFNSHHFKGQNGRVSIVSARTRD